MSRKYIDLIGHKYGMLTVLENKGSDKHGNKLWLCQCECGNTKIIVGRSMRQGSTISCGCNRRHRKDPYINAAKSVWSTTYADSNLTFKQFLKLSQLPCHYCGALPLRKFFRKCKTFSTEWQKINEKNPFMYNGLDRIDSNKKHTTNNVVPCCYQCNISKLDHTVEEFRNWIKRVYEKQFGGSL